MMAYDDWTRGTPRILVYTCAEGHLWYLPRVRCPGCGGEATSFEPDGTGTVLALTSMHRRGDGATEVLRIALVDLDIGVRMMTRAGADAAIGSRVLVSTAPVGPDHRLLPICEVLSA